MISSLLKSNDELFKHTKEDMSLKDTELPPEGNKPNFSQEKELRWSEARMSNSALSNKAPESISGNENQLMRELENVSNGSKTIQTFQRSNAFFLNVSIRHIYAFAQADQTMLGDCNEATANFQCSRVLKNLTIAF